MPTPTPQSRQGPSQSAADPFAGPAPTRGAGGAPVLPGRAYAWSYSVSPTNLHCRRGEILPTLRRATHAPGINGNGRVLGRGEGARAKQLGKGYIEVPHDIEVMAFGETRRGYMVPYDTPTNDKGTTVRTWLHCWKRPRQFGTQLRYEHDEEGWMDFHRRCLALVAPSGLDPLQIEMATSGLISICRTLARGWRRTGAPQMPHELEEKLRQLPYEHAPLDIQGLMADNGLVGVQTAPTVSEPTLADVDPVTALLHGNVKQVSAKVAACTDLALLEEARAVATRTTIQAVLDKRSADLGGTE